MERELGVAELHRMLIVGAPRSTGASMRRRLPIFEMRRCLGRLVRRTACVTTGSLAE